MSSNSLSLPVDIPWERWCVSEDMMDKEACDSDRPAKWQSSIAAFKYVPEDDYQVYPGRKITYLKIVCTISGYQPKEDEIQGILKKLSGFNETTIEQAELERRLSSYRPCNEAIVQVTVAPPAGSAIPIDKYPYVMDFQPKKREFYEMATDTREFMSRSLESLNIRKSSGTTESQEVLDIDQGKSGGLGVNIAGYGGNLQGSYSGQWGPKNLSSAETGDVRTTDESRERRETVSHTTQLSQLYHMLDSYHLGTNRVVFFVQPRPEVLQKPSGFVNGPRPIEGIQEFFLIINQPKDQQDFCLDVRLDTGHLFERPIMEYDYKSDAAEFAFSNPTPIKDDLDLIPDGEIWGDNPVHEDKWIDGGKLGNFHIWTYDAKVKYKCFLRTKSGSNVYQSPFTNYDIDVNNEGRNNDNVGGFHILPGNTVGDVSFSINPTPDGKTLTIQVAGTSRSCFKLGIGDIYEKVWVNPDIENIVKGIRAAALVAGGLGDIVNAATLFTLSDTITAAAGLIITEQAIKTGYAYATAPDSIHQQPSSAEVKLEVFLKSRQKIIDTGRAEKIFLITTRQLCCCDEEGSSSEEGFVFEGSQPIWQGVNEMTIEESRQLHAAMRDEMLNSLVSPRRTGPRPLKDTKIFTDLILPVLLPNPVVRLYLNQPSADAIPAKLAKSLPKTFRNNLKQVSRLDLLTMNTPALAKASGLDEAAVLQLKAAMLTTPFKALEIPKQVKAVQKEKAKSSKKASSKKPRSAKSSR